MSTKQVALLYHDTQRLTRADVDLIQRALQLQVDRDFAPAWNKSAVIGVYDAAHLAPIDSWKIFIQDKEDDVGFHCLQNQQPYAKVSANADLPEVCKVCSHELLEMLIDPEGNAVKLGPSIFWPGKVVEYLMEICDPCQEAEYQIGIANLAVAEFVLPAYYDNNGAIGGASYSNRDSVTGPFTVNRGGYVTWRDPDNDTWQFAHALANGLQGPINLPGPPIIAFCPGITARRRWVDEQSRQHFKEFIEKMSPADREDYQSFCAECQKGRGTKANDSCSQAKP